MKTQEREVLDALAKHPKWAWRKGMIVSDLDHDYGLGQVLDTYLNAVTVYWVNERETSTLAVEYPLKSGRLSSKGPHYSPGPTCTPTHGKYQELKLEPSGALTHTLLDELTATVEEVSIRLEEEEYMITIFSGERQYLIEHAQLPIALGMALLNEWGSSGS